MVWRLGNLYGLNLFVIFLFLVMQPQMFGISLRSTLLLSPDIAAIMILSIAVASGWCLLYPLLFRQLLRTESPPIGG